MTDKEALAEPKLLSVTVTLDFGEGVATEHFSPEEWRARSEIVNAAVEWYITSGIDKKDRLRTATKKHWDARR